MELNANGFIQWKGFRVKLLLGLLLGILAFFVSNSAYALPVIPGAAGYGMDTPAGRGGKVYKVTSLEDRNVPGTLRYAISQSGPRTVIFEVSGTITINNYLDIVDPYLTIAGQTAPSPGIFIRGGNMRILTHDVLIQHLRIAPGDEAYAVTPTNRDAVNIDDAGGTIPNNIVVDHSTFTWSVDEVVSAYGQYGNITFSNIIASEPLNNSIHVDEGATTPAPHGFGPLFDNQPNSKVTLSGSLLSHAEGRIPYAMSSEYVQVNNVLYDRINSFTRLSTQRNVPTKNTIVGNIFKNGPSLAEWARGNKPIEINANMAAGSQVYVADNVAINHSFPTIDQWDFVDNNSSLTQQQLQLSSPVAWNTGMNVKPSGEVFNWVMSNAGARPADRLPYETRIINQAINGTGTIMDSMTEVGGWPVVPANSRQLVIPKNPSADNDGDGYSNLEEWLASYAAYVEGRGGQPPLINPADGEPEDTQNGEIQPAIISNLTINPAGQQGNPWSVMTNFKLGDLVYGDRAFKFEGVPSLVKGGSWIMTNANSKNYQATDVLATFTVTADADVFLAFDDRMNPRPTWLETEGWVDTGENVLITGTPLLPFSLYKKSFAAGSTVTLWKSANKTNLFYIPIATMKPKTELSGTTLVRAGTEVKTSLKLANVSSSVYAQDVTFRFDANAFDFVSVTPTKADTVVASVYTGVPGEVRVITTSNSVIQHQESFYDLTLRAKVVSENINSSIEVQSAKLKFPEGSTVDAITGAPHSIRIYNPDLNGKQGVNLVDLTLMVAYYGKNQSHPNWSHFSIADLNGDGIINKEDLKLLVAELLE